jgi:DnaK suppressor protein
MKRGQNQRFKVLLEVQQHELRLSIEHQQRSAQRSELEPDVIDHATSVYYNESLLQRRSREHGLLRMVEAALGRIQDGSFGQCLSCKKEIDDKRLQAVPWTRYCLHCQEDAER